MYKAEEMHSVYRPRELKKLTQLTRFRKFRKPTRLRKLQDS